MAIRLQTLVRLGLVGKDFAGTTVRHVCQVVVLFCRILILAVLDPRIMLAFCGAHIVLHIAVALLISVELPEISNIFYAPYVAAVALFGFIPFADGKSVALELAYHVIYCLLNMVLAAIWYVDTFLSPETWFSLPLMTGEND